MSPTPSGDGPTEAAGTAAPLRRGDTRQPRDPPGPTSTSSEEPRKALPGPTDQPPSGARRDGPPGSIDQPFGGGELDPHGVWRHRRPTRHHRQLFGAVTGAKAGTTQLFGAAEPTNGTLAQRQRPDSDPFGGHWKGTGSHRPDGNLFGGNQTGSGTATAQTATSSGETRQAAAPAKGIATAQTATPSGATEKAPAASAQTATPSGATEKALAQRRAPRSPTRPKHPDQCKAP